jgi:heterotetrameric sarcosine oxidase gamma subunit
MVEAAGLAVTLESHWSVGALRYLDAAALDAATLARLGGKLPRAGEALEVPDLVLAWRGPRETLVFTPSADTLAALAAALAPAERACLVDQSQGYRTIRLEGPRTLDLLLRLASSDCVPAAGQALQGRFADLPVMAFALADGATRLVVERVYAEHLLAWIEATVADFGPIDFAPDPV